jgi:hypothetical protein
VFDIDLLAAEAPLVVVEVFLLFVHEFGECFGILDFDMGQGASGCGV